LREAYGFKDARLSERMGKGAPTELQKDSKARRRDAIEYEDIKLQIEKECHGAKGYKRKEYLEGWVWKKAVANGKTGDWFKRGTEKGKMEKITPMDRLVETLSVTASREYARAPLASPDLWPKPDRAFPEVAFAGRSNVGKSSLLNRISEYGSVAKTSPNPGETTELIWYQNRKTRLSIIDMPGYGFANYAQIFGPDAIKFVTERTSIKRLYVLIDARHGLKRADHEWLEALGHKGPMKQIILTKCDAVNPKQLLTIASLVRSDLMVHKRCVQKVLLTSANHKTGLDELRLDILSACGRQPMKKHFIEKKSMWNKGMNWKEEKLKRQTAGNSADD